MDSSPSASLYSNKVQLYFLSFLKFYLIVNTVEVVVHCWIWYTTTYSFLNCTLQLSSGTPQDSHILYRVERKPRNFFTINSYYHPFNHTFLVYSIILSKYLHWQIGGTFDGWPFLVNLDHWIFSCIDEISLSLTASSFRWMTTWEGIHLCINVQWYFVEF